METATHQVKRSEILDDRTYEERRVTIREQVLKEIETRQIQLGDHLTFLFENHDTIRYQIQEMVRTEKIATEADIQHEIDTYNQILGHPGDLGATLLIGTTQKSTSDKMRKELMEVPETVYLVLLNGKKVYGEVDSAKVGKGRQSSVFSLRFSAEGKRPVALGVEHPSFTLELNLSSEQQLALAADCEIKEPPKMPTYRYSQPPTKTG